MKLNIEQKEVIRHRFFRTNTTRELAELLSWVYKKKFPNADPRAPVIIEEKHLNYYAFGRKEHYKDFALRKKSGGRRAISAPKYKLKTIQKCLNEVFNAIYKPHKTANGFVTGKSIISNASVHVKKQYVYNIDLENFFPSITFRRVKTVLGLSPFNLGDSENKTKEDPKEQLAFLIANLCCKDGYLPQGAPTSPTLTNMVCRRLDIKLSKLAKENSASYTRYADDITFSSYKNIFDEIFRKKLIRIIENEENLKINYEKERLQTSKERQIVTGLVVNSKPNVPRKFVKDIRFWLMCWDRFGVSATQTRFIREFPTKKSFLKYHMKAPLFYEYLKGKILFLGMVRGEDDAMFTRFVSEINRLLILSNLVPIGRNTESVLKLLDEWDSFGLDHVVKNELY